MIQKKTGPISAFSRTEVRFHTGETLGLTPNTLVVLRPPGKKNADAQMLAGELLSRHSRVVTRTATILPKTADAKFSARMKKDLAKLLPPGDYFIRLAKIDLLGYKEKFSAPRPIKINGMDAAH